MGGEVKTVGALTMNLITLETLQDLKFQLWLEFYTNFSGWVGGWLFGWCGFVKFKGLLQFQLLLEMEECKYF